MFFVVQLATMLILWTGANTPFNGFPYLANFVAADGFLPRWLTKRGHRLAFSNGIIVLAVIALALILGTGAHVPDTSVNRSCLPSADQPLARRSRRSFARARSRSSLPVPSAGRQNSSG